MVEFQSITRGILVPREKRYGMFQILWRVCWENKILETKIWR